jgi:OPA family glycerol-3-phosphate transporter-like MFS transporter
MSEHQPPINPNTDAPLGPDGKPDWGAVVTPEHPIFRHDPGYRPRRGRNWFFLGLTYASYYLCRYNLSIIAPELKAELGLSNSQYGAIQSSRDGMYALGQFFNGLFTDRLGGKLGMTIGAIGTIILNVIFGLTTWSSIGWLFFALMLIRGADGYVQAFGSPGMVKINTAWFRKQERGTFAGIFGGMIQLGAIGVGFLGKALATGIAVPLIFFTITIPALDWRYMFFVPPAITFIIIILMNLTVKNHPEEAGFRVIHDDESHDDDPHQLHLLRDVFFKITSNPIAWINAGAYFCTGFVRTGINAWWVVYLLEAWGIGKLSMTFGALAFLLPFTAFVGSFSSGVISDKLFKGRRAPVAASIYLFESLFILVALLLSMGVIPGASGVLLAALIVGVNITCNSSHSIIGTAAAMDLGGRKMAGFASGVIDSFQYFGAMLAGFGLGWFMDRNGIVALDELGNPMTSDAGQVIKHINGSVWFASMLPFALLGAMFMGYLWIAHRNKSTPGT